MVQKIIIVYLIVMNLIAWIAMGVDKQKAAHHKWRIPERTLMLLAAIGGSIGGILGMFLFHHKTKHPKFYIGMPLILILQIALAVWIRKAFGF